MYFNSYRIKNISGRYRFIRITEQQQIRAVNGVNDRGKIFVQGTGLLACVYDFKAVLRMEFFKIEDGLKGNAVFALRAAV